jgi:hypothetical protein
MKTFQTRISDENHITKQLFQQLFYFQLELEGVKANSDFPKERIELIMELSDRFMTLLLENYNLDD